MMYSSFFFDLFFYCSDLLTRRHHRWEPTQNYNTKMDDHRRWRSDELLSDQPGSGRFTGRDSSGPSVHLSGSDGQLASW